MAQTSSVPRSGMGSLFAGIMEGWEGVGKIFDDVEIQRKTQKIREDGEAQIKKDRDATNRSNAGSTKLSTALLESPDVTGPTQTTQTGATPKAIPVGGPSGTTTAEPALTTIAPKPGDQLTPPGVTAPTVPATPPAVPPLPIPGAASATPSTSTAPAPELPPAPPAGRITPADYGVPNPAPAAPASSPAAAPFAQALPTSPAYADAAMGQNLLGVTSPGASSRRRRPGALDFTPEQQQAIATAPLVAAARAPIRTAQRPASTLLPQVDLFGNPILPPTVSNV